jgi:hypothetical protein
MLMLPDRTYSRPASTSTVLAPMPSHSRHCCCQPAGHAPLAQQAVPVNCIKGRMCMHSQLHICCAMICRCSPHFGQLVQRQHATVMYSHKHACAVHCTRVNVAGSLIGQLAPDRYGNHADTYILQPFDTPSQMQCTSNGTLTNPAHLQPPNIRQQWLLCVAFIRYTWSVLQIRYANLPTKHQNAQAASIAGSHHIESHEVHHTRRNTPPSPRHPC